MPSEMDGAPAVRVLQLHLLRSAHLDQALQHIHVRILLGSEMDGPVAVHVLQPQLCSAPPVPTIVLNFNWKSHPVD